MQVTLVIILVLFLTLLCLSSCSVQELLASFTGVNDDNDYKEWKRLEASGQLDENGEYTKDAVHVTMGTNAFLEIAYFTDSEMQDPITGSSLYMVPGNCVYAKVEKVKNPYTDRYRFKGFRIMEYDKNGNRLGELNWYNGSDDLLFMLPSDFKGTDIGIEPVGEYLERNIRFCEQVANKELPPVGSRWEVNNKRITGETCIVSSVDPYTVNYYYDPGKYFFVSSEPVCFSNIIVDNEGIISFEQTDPLSSIDTYDVVLSEYYFVTVKCENGDLQKVLVNKEEQPDISGREKKDIKVKSTDDIMIISTGNKAKVEGDWQHKTEKIEQNNDGSYTIVFESGSDEDFVFDPSKYQPDHATLKYFLNGTEIVAEANLPYDSVLSYEFVNIDDGYWYPDEIRDIRVNGESTKEELEKIQIYPDNVVNIYLPQFPGGTLIYKVNGRELTGENAEVRYGTLITAEPKAWNGWTTDISRIDYRVEENNKLVIPVNDGMFTEQAKPNLELKIKVSVPQTKITIRAEELEKQISYAPGDIFAAVFNGQVQTIVNQRIGTVGNIQITLDDIDPDTLSFINVAIIRDGVKEEMLVNSGEPIVLQVYPDNNREKLIQNITVELSLAGCYVPGDYEHVHVSLLKNDNEITDGYLFLDERVKVVLVPDEMHYFVGANTMDDCFSQEMAYGEYLDKSFDDVFKNQMKEKKKVTLVEKGKYGTSAYKVNGVAVNGTVLLKDTDRLEATYTITNNAYEIGSKTLIFIDSPTSMQTMSIPATEWNNSINAEDKLLDSIRKKGN